GPDRGLGSGCGWCAASSGPDTYSLGASHYLGTHCGRAGLSFRAETTVTMADGCSAGGVSDVSGTRLVVDTRLAGLVPGYLDQPLYRHATRGFTCRQQLVAQTGGRLAGKGVA